MSLFHRSISFSQTDPLGGGLREEIEHEQLEPEAIMLGDEDGSQLITTWQHIAEDVEKDPDWFQFSDDDDAA